jgi:hypothetical protein
MVGPQSARRGLTTKATKTTKVQRPLAEELARSADLLAAFAVFVFKTSERDLAMGPRDEPEGDGKGTLQ